jgi:hypothetical protein
MVILELVFWTLFFFSIWINDVWTFLGLGVLGVSALFIGQLRKEKAEKDADEMFFNSNKGAKETKNK